MVIDVGTNPVPGGGLAGDVDAAAVTGVARLLTPVPGGVGPVTTAMLIQHTVLAAAGGRGALTYNLYVSACGISSRTPYPFTY